jgi:pimeloyl-ACP methyl ester carboxylesterase
MDGNGTFIQVRDCTAHVWRGRGPGTPLVFLHGASGAPVWAPYMDLLAQHFDLFLPEHPGFGRSTPVDSVESISDLAFFSLDFLDTLGLPAVHLAGTSMGGWVAAEIAIRKCSRLRSLTLIGPAGDDDGIADHSMASITQVLRGYPDFCNFPLVSDNRCSNEGDPCGLNSFDFNALNHLDFRGNWSVVFGATQVPAITAIYTQNSIVGGDNN